VSRLNARNYGRAVACGFGRFAAAYEVGTQSTLNRVPSTGRIDIHTFTNVIASEVAIYTPSLHRIYDEDERITITEPGTLSLKIASMAVGSGAPSAKTFRIYNWASGMAIEDNVIYVTADAWLPLNPALNNSTTISAEDDEWYSMLLTYSLVNGDLLNYSIADSHRPRAFSQTTDNMISLKSTVPPMTGGNINNTDVPKASYQSILIGGESQPGNLGASDWIAANNRISVGSGRVVIGAPWWSPNTTFESGIGDTLLSGCGNAYVFDMSGNYMYNLFGEPPTQFSNWGFRGSAVSAGMGVIGASGVNRAAGEELSGNMEFCFFDATTNYKHVMYPYDTDFGDSMSDTAIQSGRSAMNFPSSTSTYKMVDGRSVGMLLAGGVRFTTVAYDDTEVRCKIELMDEDFFPISRLGSSVPQQVTLTAAAYPTELTYNIDRGIFGKMKYSNGKMISSMNLYTSLPTRQVVVWQWPNRTHSRDMMEIMR
jgi:hypothetical protein